jgi:uncharacterized protein
MAAPIPPFTRESAIVKVRVAEDGWNSRDPHRVSLAYTEDSRWRNRAEFNGNWFRSYGNENWEFDAAGVMQWRFASINDLPISKADRKYHWPLGRRPDDHPGLSDLDL